MKTNFFKIAALAAGAVGVVTLLTSSASAEQPDEPPQPTEQTDTSTTSAAPAQVEEFTDQRLRRNRRAMKVLGAWSVANIGVGTAGALTTDGATQQFHVMNMGWNLVNAAIAAFGYAGAAGEDPQQGQLLEALDDAHGDEKLFLVNIGLNVAYIATGGFLWERGIRTDSDRLRGWGPSLMVQGAFLLGFDTVMYGLANRHRRQFQLDIAPRIGEQTGVSATVRF